MKRYFDELETGAADERESHLMSVLPRQIAHAKAKSTYFAQLLQKVEPHGIDSRRALAELPVTRKAQLVEQQKQLRSEERRVGKEGGARGAAQLVMEHAEDAS